jgi:tetratricopeptide (TPR) repeat protein
MTNASHPGARMQEAVSLARAGRAAEAAALLQAITRADPRFMPAHGMLGDLLAGAGRLPEAVQAYDAAIALDPRQPDLRYNRANALAGQGRFEEAAEGFGEAVRLNPRHALALVNHGNALFMLARMDEALARYDQAIAVQPNLIQAHTSRGNLLLRLERNAEALAACDRAIALQPDHPSAHANRAAALFALDRLEEAVAACDRAIAVQPRLTAVYAVRGNALRCLGRHAEALASCDAGLALGDSASLRHNRGCVLYEQARLDEAMAAFQACLTMDPGHAEARLNTAYVQLARGDYGPGWQAYEARLGPLVPERPFAQPRWRGEDLNGRTLLLTSEQGLGDTLQFARYAALAARRGGKVVLEAPPELAALLSSLEGVQVIAEGNPLPAFDLHSPLMSLPLIMGTQLATVPGEAYLRADPHRAAAWRARLGPAAKPRIGLVWASGRRPGRPDKRGDLRRDIPLLKLLEAARPDLEFISLQKGLDAEAELKAAPGAVIDPAADLRDFADTAALIDGLDLVISVDTAPAHLAGALGKPTLTLLRYDACWRWLTQRADSPWYPSMRLLRQAAPGDWDSVIDQLKAALAERYG